MSLDMLRSFLRDATYNAVCHYLINVSDVARNDGASHEQSKGTLLMNSMGQGTQLYCR